MGKEIITQIYSRIYSDFLMTSRLGEYRLLLEEALNHDYEIHTISSFWELIKNAAIDNDTRYLILRHDIDTGKKTVKEIWQIGTSLGVAGSYYFRLSTIDIELMNGIAERGGEASYHFEEVASIAKQMGLVSIDDVKAEMPRIRDAFSRNLLHLREITGLPMTIVASHGDFINRRLGIKNSVILEDPQLRKELNIELEVYDDNFMNHVQARCSDTHYPLYWKPSSPLAAIRSGVQIIYVLIHPRHWHAERIINALDDLTRTAQSATYGIRKLRNTSHKPHLIIKEPCAPQ